MLTTILYSESFITKKVAIAVEMYPATDAVEGSGLSCTTYSDGGSYGDHVSRLVGELEAKTIYLGQRMHGTPRGLPQGD